MRRELHKSSRIKRKPKYPLMSMSKLQATAVVAASASLVFVFLAARMF